MKDYYYELKHVNGDEILTYKFPADIDVYALEIYLTYFLKGCSWTDEVLSKLFNGGE